MRKIYKLSISYIWVSFIRLVIICTAVIIATFFIPIEEIVPFRIIVSSVVFVVFLYVSSRIILKYHRFYIKIRKNCLVIKNGSFIINERFIKLEHLQYVIRLRTPILWLFSMSALVMFLPGGIVVTPPMRKSDARELYLKLQPDSRGNENGG